MEGGRAAGSVSKGRCEGEKGKEKGREKGREQHRVWEGQDGREMEGRGD